MGVLDAFDLSGKVAVVTGGNRGLGEAWVRALADVGATVIIAARDDERSERTRASVGGDVDTVGLDVRDPAGVRAALDKVVERHGRVDILVNNAGTCIHRPALEVSDDEWDQVIDVNLNGLWRCSQGFGRHMVDNGGGVIVNIGSISAQIVNRPQMQPAYNASKAAVHQLTKSLAAEWAPYGVRVNALAPGYVKTEMAAVDRPEFRRHWIEDAPMQRYAMPDELGPALVFLASDASSFMTGATLVIDGGYTLW
ncbi:MAG: glucose 1-dehydrogenase [Actinobacteria bacterium]|nr:MAG: glucose 1-dehydrogenase [Actinomycetota bacterium]